MDSLSVEMEVWMTQPPRVCGTSLNSSFVPIHKHTHAEKHSMHAHPQMFECVQRSDSMHRCTMAHSLSLSHTHTHTHTNTWTCRLEADVARVNGRMFFNGPRFLLIYKTFLCLCLTFLIRHYLDKSWFLKTDKPKECCAFHIHTLPRVNAFSLPTCQMRQLGQWPYASDYNTLHTAPMSVLHLHITRIHMHSK